MLRLKTKSGTKLLLLTAILGHSKLVAASDTSKPLTAEELIIENPVREAEKYLRRLQEFGPNAPFPEFQPVVHQIHSDLINPEFLKKLALHPDLRFEYAEVMTFLTHINLNFTYEDRAKYPYINGFEHPFPYRPTIDAIEAALRLFDKIERLENPDVVPLYHFDRYAYHRHSLLADPDIVIFPTMRNLTFSDLIRVRAVPLNFVGVSTKTLRVDRYFQSPLDFWYHDLNHVRRLAAYLRLKVQAANAKTLKQKLALYRQMDRFVTEKIMPGIQKLPSGSSPEDIAIRRLVRLIVFEIFHESAVAPDVPSIVNDLLRGGDQKTSYEIMRLNPDLTRTDLEALRTAVGNVQSGAKTISQVNPNYNSVMIHFYMERDLGLLANIYNKLIFGYYDEPGKPSALICPVEFRKAEFLVKASRALLTAIGATDANAAISDQQLRTLVLSKEGRPELFNYEGIALHEADLEEQGPYVTEPLEGKDVIQEINLFKLKQKKRVLTLFGFSDLGYKNPEELLQKVALDLQKYDPKKWIINIGATVDGIGAAYEIAKKMGFETIGLVSIQALSYSGQFSKFVDRIYIVNDQKWGGFIPGTKRLAPTTDAYIKVSDRIKAYGGNRNTKAALRGALDAGVPVDFDAFEMHPANGTSGAAEDYWRRNQRYIRDKQTRCEFAFK